MKKVYLFEEYVTELENTYTRFVSTSMKKVKEYAEKYYNEILSSDDNFDCKLNTFFIKEIELDKPCVYNKTYFLQRDNNSKIIGWE